MARSLIIVLTLACAASSALATKKLTLHGTWSSPKCGGRAYERRITFAADGTFTSEDRVSPCPKDAVCVWSGIVLRKGTFKLTGTTVALTPEAPEQRQGVPLPERLSFKKGELAEDACAYSRSKS